MNEITQLAIILFSVNLPQLLVITVSSSGLGTKPVDDRIGSVLLVYTFSRLSITTFSN